jgi:hypothetical protein
MPATLRDVVEDRTWRTSTPRLSGDCLHPPAVIPRLIHPQEGSTVTVTPHSHGEKPLTPGGDRLEDRRPSTPMPDGFDPFLHAPAGLPMVGPAALAPSVPARSPKRHKRHQTAESRRKEARGWTGAKHQ